ncbi:hypothetical protein LOZ80_15280 [Paenibacillus sp. HWE-109]|uniref:hypothetical protein n=1 Tax=Paenibacillus sp. HWE-109 TaxID=1306526 RepID=UPI001EE140C6|nr:hypothetical protein [Paenibacillus sp. HWE-109]UKS30222.1 hypothetical protein LOZ80_15280 [Paenibacillus sp. HWE-109]
MKTWEMLRDIREGETYEVASGPFEGSAVTFTAYANYASKALVWNDPRFFQDVETFVPTTDILASYEWRKRQQLVDFATAFAAYEKGAWIKSEVTGDRGLKKDGWRIIFREDEIRGKWIIEEARA